MLILVNPQCCFLFQLLAGVGGRKLEPSRRRLKVKLRWRRRERGRETERAEMEMRDPRDSRERRIKGSVAYHGVKEYSRYKRQKEIVKAQKGGRTPHSLKDWEEMCEASKTVIERWDCSIRFMSLGTERLSRCRF